MSVRRGVGLMGIVACVLVPAMPLHAQEDPAGGAILEVDRPTNTETPEATDGGAPAPAATAVATPAPAAPAAQNVPQIQPPSPVAGGNDLNASDDVLYILQQDNEDEAEIVADERGIAKRGPTYKPHVFVNPMARVAGKYLFSPRFSVEAFVTGGSGAFRRADVDFGTRASNISGGVNINADAGLFNAALAYEHRDAYAAVFGPWTSTGDKVGATFNKTYPFFVEHLTVTPQLLTTREAVNPLNASSAQVQGTVGFTYDVSRRLSVAVSGGYSVVFLYGVPGFRHDDGLKLLLGATYKPTDRLTMTLGATTTRTILYGLPTYRADGAIGPAATAKYAIARYLTVGISADYGRFVSTQTGLGTFKYNLNPSVALTVPL